jgi:tRNA U34 5-carboxymethylaminomethyl modifying GTPase MnmE/TrmE
MIKSLQSSGSRVVIVNIGKTKYKKNKSKFKSFLRKINYNNLNKMSPAKQFKVVIVGDPNVGKTCLLSLFTHDTCKRHLDHYIPTTGVDFCPKSFDIDGQTYNFHFCDVSG